MLNCKRPFELHCNTCTDPDMALGAVKDESIGEELGLRLPGGRLLKEWLRRHCPKDPTQNLVCVSLGMATITLTHECLWPHPLSCLLCIPKFPV